MAVAVGVGEGGTVFAGDPLPVVAVGSTAGAGAGVVRKVGLKGSDPETVGVGDGDALVVAGEVLVEVGGVPVGVGDVVVGVALEVPVGVGVPPGVEGVGEGDAVEVAVPVVVSAAVGSGDADPDEVASDDGAFVGAASSDAVVGRVVSTVGALDSSSWPPRTVWLLSSATGMAQRCAPPSAGFAA